MTTIYRVQGMTCQGCANAVTNAIKATAPQAFVTVDLEGRQVSVDGFGNDDAIEKAVEGAGFEFSGVLGQS